MSMNDILNSIKKFVSSSSQNSGEPGSVDEQQSDVKDDTSDGLGAKDNSVVHLAPVLDEKEKQELETSSKENEREVVCMPEFIRRSFKSHEVESDKLKEIEKQGGVQNEDGEVDGSESSVELYLQQLLVSLKDISEKSEFVYQRNHGTLDDFLRSLLVNLVQEWLDKNLKNLVEQVVKQNIQRLVDSVLKKS